MNKKCIQIDNKETCSNQTTHSCEDCENGMMIGGSCSNNVDECKYYSTQIIPKSIDKCHQCNTNYYLINDNQTCSTIPSEEILYIESNVHYKCQDQYYLNTEMKCTLCQQTDSNSNVCEYHNDYFHSYTCQNERFLDIRSLICNEDEQCKTFNNSLCYDCKIHQIIISMMEDVLIVK